MHQRRWSIRFALAALLGALVGASADEATYRLARWDELSDRRLSALGKLVYQADRERWVHAESDRVIASAFRLADLDDLVVEAEFASDAIRRALRLEAPPNKAFLFLVRDDTTWSRLVLERGFRPDGLALHYRNEIFLRDDPGQRARPDRIAHEMVHFHLRAAYGPDVPLWLDEGLAGHLGVAIARDFRARRERRLTGELPALPAEAWLPLAELTARRGLPDRPELANVYYREAQELVTAIAGRIGEERLPEFVQRVAGGRSWRRVLEKTFGWAPADFEELESAVRQKVTSARNL